ncbi:MAG: dihydroorotase [Candidatus Omnitrophica bacterium]|nr:dihydroorotase [Candidatus Omnitrophota bacterium]
MSLLIKNAKIVGPDKIALKAQNILIEKGMIKEITGEECPSNIKTIDARGCYVVPGFIDLHVHFREPGREDKETIETGSKAAVKGGFTTVLCMPNTTPVIDNKLIVEGIMKEARRVGLLNVIPVGAITKGQKGEELSDLFELKEAGCLAVSEDGATVQNSNLMRLAMDYCKMTGLFVMDHCQDGFLSQGGVMNEGYHSTVLGMKGDPGISETVVVARDIELSRYLNAPIHLVHMSLKRSMELIQQAKKQGIQVTAEACPHHFSLSDDMVASFNTSFKVNPPLRSKEDVSAIKKAIKDGVIDCISTDHAPHTREDKEQDFDHAPFGMIGLETALGVTVSELVLQDYLTWPQLVQRMSLKPAELLQLDNKGKIKEGFDADITIIDPEAEWEVRAEDFVSKSSNSPFIGRTLKSKVKYTIYGGKVVYQCYTKSIN